MFADLRAAKSATASIASHPANRLHVRLLGMKISGATRDSDRDLGHKTDSKRSQQVLKMRSAAAVDWN